VVKRIYNMVSERALMARVNRSLVDSHEMVKKARGEYARRELGEFYLLDFNRNAILRQDLDLEDYAREIKVLLPYEKLYRPEDEEK
jgi:hypothetical protein